MRKFSKISYKPLVLVLVVVFCLFLLPTPSHAQAYEPSPSLFGCATNPIDCMLYFVRSLLVTLIALVGSGIDIALRAPIASIPVVVESWEIVRGFANMFFIIALIIMAFGTIFSISKYDFRTLIARFLVAALLINFSLVIGEIIIDWSTSLSNVFLDAIGNVGDRLAQGANIAKHLDSGGLSQATSPVSQVSWSQTMVNAVNIVMLSILFFSLTVLLFFSIIRIPVLWALLIVSPIAWITYVLPTTMNVNRSWWKEFIAWNVFMPVYLFFIYFGVLFLNNQQKVLANTSGPLISGFSTAFQDIFFYLLIGLFLIGGAKFAISSSRSAGARTVAAGTWARGRAIARFTGVGLSRRIPGIKQIEPLYKAAGQRMTQFQKESEKALQQRQSIWGGRFGVKGVSEQQFNKDIENAMQEMKDKKIYDKKDLLLEKVDTGTSAEKVAAYKLLKEFHQEEGSAEQIKKVAQAFRDANLTAQESKFMAGLDYNKLSKQDIDQILEETQARKANGEEGMFAASPYAKQLKERSTDARIKKGVTNSQQLIGLLGNYDKDEDILDALNKVDKDLMDSFTKDENTALFNYLASRKVKDSQKKITNTMLKKGQFTDELESGLIFGTYDQQTGKITGGLYENDFERERALKLAEETRLMSVLRVRRQLDLLGKSEDGSPKTYNQVKAAAIKRLSAEGIAKLKIDDYESRDGKKEELFDELEGFITPKKITGMKQNKEWTGAHDEFYDPLFSRFNVTTQGKRKNRGGGTSGTPPPSSPPPSSTPPSLPPPQPKPKPTPVYIPNPRRPSGAEAIPEFEPTRPAPPQHLGGPTVIGEPPEPESKVGEKSIPKNFEGENKLQPAKIKSNQRGVWRLVGDNESFTPGREFEIDISSGKNYVKMTPEEIDKFNLNKK